MLLQKHEFKYIQKVLGESERRKRSFFIKGARYGVWSRRIVRKISAASDKHLVKPSKEDESQMFAQEKQSVKYWT